MIDPGSYHWTRFRLEGALASKRKLSGQLTWWFGDFYTGRLDELTFTASWKPSPLFIVELNGTRILDADLSKVTEFKDKQPHPGQNNVKGHFGFAGHNDPVAFRNIRIKELAEKK